MRDGLTMNVDKSYIMDKIEEYKSAITTTMNKISKAAGINDEPESVEDLVTRWFDRCEKIASECGKTAYYFIGENDDSLLHGMDGAMFLPTKKLGRQYSHIALSVIIGDKLDKKTKCDYPLFINNEDITVYIKRTEPNTALKKLGYWAAYEMI